MTTDNDKAPEWMTEEWLASAKLLTDSPTWEWTRVAGAAREILRLRAELAKRTAFIASLPNLKEAGEMCKQAAAELATLTAELATLREHADHDAGEILRLGGELADIKACDGPIAQAEAYGESMRHENDGLRAEIAAAQMILPMSTGTLADSARTLRTERENARAERNKAEAERDAFRAEIARMSAEMGLPAGERIRPFSEWSEFDGEALWFHLPVVESAFYVGRPDDSGWPYDGDPDGPDDSDQIGWVPVPRLASDGSELLRKAAPSTEGQSSILPLVRADGRTLRVGAIAGGAHPNDRRDGFPAELRLELGDVSRRHSCRYVRQAEGVSEGVSAGGCKAAGAAAPVGPSITALIQGAEDAAVEWGKCVGDYHGACRVAPPPSPRDVSDAVRESGRKCEHAWDVLRKAIRAIAADLHQSTPAADARQPDDAAKLAEVEKREADGIKLFDDLLATERAKVATMSIELDGLRARLAASEKAKVDQVVLVMNLRRALGMVRAKVGRVLGPQWEDNGHVGQVIRAAVELCAERAGGAL